MQINIIMHVSAFLFAIYTRKDFCNWRNDLRQSERNGAKTVAILPIKRECAYFDTPSLNRY